MHEALSLPVTVASVTPHRRTRRRRLPSPQEQERREKWGKEWGERVSKATADLRKG